MKLLFDQNLSFNLCEALEQLCDKAIAANSGLAADFKAGKAAALNLLKVQVMKLSKSKANPVLVGEILDRKLKGSRA